MVPSAVTGPVIGEPLAAPSAHLAIVGPTAAGKSQLAMALASACPGTEIVSVDSMAVYRHMDLATAKPSGEERRRVAHHLLDLVDPDEEFTVAEFQRLARSALTAIERRGHRAILVGGTGLYVRAVLDGLHLPGRWPEVAAALEASADRPGGVAALYRQLQRVDPAAAARIEPGNRRRIVRALEVTIGSGRAFSSFGPGLGCYPSVPVVQLGLWAPRSELDRRVMERLERWMANGLLDEVRALASWPRPLSRTARQAVAYRELLDHLEGAMPLTDALALAAARSRRLVRRQLAWFRRDPRVQWLASDGDVVAEAWRRWLAGPPAAAEPSTVTAS
jgi:tRNA dimethylallyltransferase